MLVDLKKNIILLCLFLLSTTIAFASLTKIEKTFTYPRRLSVDVCRSRGLGIEIACKPSWEFIEKETAALLRIADYPETLVIIAKTDSSIVFLEQLTRGDLESTGRYARGFEFEEVLLDGQKALKVKAFSNGDTSARLVDYYFIRDEALWGLFFSVQPLEGWEEVKFLFVDLVKSFHFMN